MQTRSLVGAAAPVVAAVGAFGIVFGVLASTAGVPAWQATLMSATVFAGSAQFAALAVFAGGGSFVSVVLAGALLNSRYLATGIAAGRALPGGRLRRFLLAQLVVDESYAIGVSAGSPGRPEPGAMVGSGVALWAAWTVCTLIGALLGPVIDDPERLGLDAAFPALFVALVWPMLHRRRLMLAAGAGALTALVLAPVLPRGLPLLAAAVAGVAVVGDGTEG